MTPFSRLERFLQLLQNFNGGLLTAVGLIEATIQLHKGELETMELEIDSDRTNCLIGWLSGQPSKLSPLVCVRVAEYTRSDFNFGRAYFQRRFSLNHREVYSSLFE